MLSKSKDWFNFCSYWGTWNRTLLRRGGDYSHQIEISLYPVNKDIPSSWDNFLECRVRRHCTSPSLSDKYTHHLPDFVYNELVSRYDTAVADMFVHNDLYNAIDWVKFEEVDRYWTKGGGVPLMMVLKPDFVLPRLMSQYWERVEGGLTGDYYRSRDASMARMEAILSQRRPPAAGEFDRFMDYITTADHVWDREKYLSSRVAQGTSFGLESRFTYQYLLGNAYCEGYIGEWQFRVFKNHATFQLYLKHRDDKWPETCTYSVSSHQRKEFVDFIANKICN